jgi:hypothetical protein
VTFHLTKYLCLRMLSALARTGHTEQFP